MYFRLSIGGTIGTYEKWSINPVYDPEGEVPGNAWNQPNAQLMVSAAAAVTVPSRIKQALSAQAAVTSFRLEGRSDTDDSLYGFATAAPGAPVVGTGSALLPPQSAIVVSLITDTPGARGRGRLYFPGFGSQLATTFRLNAPTSADFAADAKTYLSAIQTAMLAAIGSPPFTGLRLAVRSRQSRTTHPVTSLRVGDVLDTQRRRRDRLPETYSSLSFP